MTGNKSGELLGVGLRALALSAALLLALPAATAISGCSSTNSYQVEDRSTGGRSRPQSAGKPGKNQYRVQKGDTLYSVAQKIGYRFDYHYLAKKNGIKPPYAIEKGQILNISDDCGGCRVHVVKSGETLYSTAFLYHTTVGKLAALNGFSVQTKLNAGQNIIVSEGKSSAWPSAKPGKTGTGSAAGTGKGSSAGSSKPVRTADDTPAPVASRSGISWRWPASGKVVRGFSVAENGNKGIPGAHDAKVVRFLDWQLAPDAPYARHLDAYRKHLALIRPDHAGDSRSPLSAAEVEKQYPDFFKMLLRHVKQGFYGHPRHGGNAGWASYRMLGIVAPSVTGRNIPGKENHL